MLKKAATSVMFLWLVFHLQSSFLLSHNAQGH